MQKEMQHCTAGRAAFHGGSAGGKLARVQMWPPYESVVFMLVALNAEQSCKPPRGTVGGEDVASIYKNCGNSFSLKDKFT